jgi:hypothetical protein
MPSHCGNTSGHGGRRQNSSRSTIDLDSSKDRIVELHCQGCTALQIAIEVKSTEITIKLWLAQWGLQKRAPWSL